MSLPRRLLVALLLGSAVACAGSQKPPDARETRVSLTNLDCAGCGTELAEALRREPQVYGATFDRRHAELTVTSSPNFDVLAAARRHAKGEEFGLELGAGKGTYLPWSKVSGGDVATIAVDGADVPDLTVHLAKGKVNVVDFSAIWCEPCRKLDEHMLELVRSRPDLAYRKLDVGDWDTPLAQRYLGRAKQLPYVIVFDRRGRRVAEVDGLNLEAIHAAIEGASR